MKGVNVTFRELWQSESPLGRAGLLVAPLVLLVLVLLAEWRTYAFALHQDQAINLFQRIFPEQLSQREALLAFVRDYPGAAVYREAVLALHPHNALNRILAMVITGFGPLGAALWGALLVGMDFGLGTAGVRAVHLGWRRVVAVKAGWIAAFAVLVATTAVLAAAVAGPVSWALLLRHSDLAGRLEPPVLETVTSVQVLVAVLVLTGWGLLGATVALVARSALAGMVFGALLPYAEVVFLRPLVKPLGLAWLLPWGLREGLVADHFAHFPGIFGVDPRMVPPVSDPGWRWLALGAWTVVLACVSVWWAGRQELP
jgi:hypothetical protein